ncbi:zinc-binding dehydrogenase, partial [Streptomyces sp. NPDC056749]|uniref:zinc-binding dehydrogenase n=1 Tax=Streptomyces sp. NPDC056749 TaxID=3345936 RepID=UPI0036BFBE71
MDLGEFYSGLAGRGYEYGPVFRGVRAAWRDGDEVFGELALPDGVEVGGFVVHPALLDSALHLIGLLPDGQGDGVGMVGLPFVWNRVAVRAVGATSVRARVSVTSEGFAVVMTDALGGEVLRADSVVTRPIAVEELRSLSTRAGGGGRGVSYVVEWEQAGDRVPAVLEGVGSGVVGVLPTRLFDGVWVFGAADELDGIVEGQGAGELPSWVVLSVPGAVEGSVGQRSRQMAGAVLDVLQAFLADPLWDGSRLAVLTRGAVAVGLRGDGGIDPAAAGVWGLVRSAQTENPGRIVLLDSDVPVKDIDPRIYQALAASDEPQAAIHEGATWLPRLTPTPTVLSIPNQDVPWYLESTGTRTLQGLTAAVRPELMRPLAPREVRIEVRAAGVNFRDALMLLGMYPGEVKLGGEAAGVVTGIGSEVGSVAVGDRVLGLFSNSFGSVAVTDARLVVPMPANWTFEEAATIPVVFLTAYFGLVDLAGLEPGEKVLIHAATGGVGMAAGQVARHLGAEVFGTASLVKHQVLRDAGYDDSHIGDSRSTSFAQHFEAVTAGRGVDVILNALTGEFIDASLQLMPRGGRFLEIGKLEIRDAEVVAQNHPGVHYQAFDLIEAASVDRISHMLAHLMELFEAGELTPLPHTIWDIQRAPEVLRDISQARHVGKNVIALPRHWDRDGVVLVTGGTGVLGGEVARHVVGVHGMR